MTKLDAPPTEEELQMLRNWYGPNYIEGKGMALIYLRRRMLWATSK